MENSLEFEYPLYQLMDSLGVWIFINLQILIFAFSKFCLLPSHQVIELLLLVYFVINFVFSLLIEEVFVNFLYFCNSQPTFRELLLIIYLRNYLISNLDCSFIKYFWLKLNKALQFFYGYYFHFLNSKSF